MPKLMSKILILISMYLAFPALSHSASISDFYGDFEGTLLIDESQDGSSAEKDRKTHVHIYESGKGFRVDWSTEITKTDGRTKSVSYSIQFLESEKTGTYSSAMKKNMFGKWIPLNPMKGEPYVWARIIGDTLSIYALIIREDGGYEMQQYDRTVLPNGNMDLTFTRIRDGVPQKVIKGVLARKEG